MRDIDNIGDWIMAGLGVLGVCVTTYGLVMIALIECS
jgi:hypothetical protein